MSDSKYRNPYSQQSSQAQSWDDDYDEYDDNDSDDDYQSGYGSGSQERYQFNISNGQVVSVFEYENNRLKQESIDFNESYQVQGQYVLKIEQERNGQEVTRYSDLDGDGLFIQDSQFWQAGSSPATPVIQPVPSSSFSSVSDPFTGKAYLSNPGAERYQFNISGGQVVSVFELEGNRLEQERIDSNEIYSVQGQDVFKIENERNGQEITKYSDLDGDGLFNKVGHVWQSNATAPVSSAFASQSSRLTGDGWYEVNGSSNAFILERSGSDVAVKDLQSNTVVELLESASRIIFSDKVVVTDRDQSATQAFRLYKAAFDRTPDHDGLKYWISKSDAGLALNDMASSFMNSSEFQSKYGTQLSNKQFLNNLYLNVLDREADAPGLQYWQNAMNNNPSLNRSKVLVEFSESAENKLAVAADLEDFQVFDVSLVGVGAATLGA